MLRQNRLPLLQYFDLRLYDHLICSILHRLHHCCWRCDVGVRRSCQQKLVNSPPPPSLSTLCLIFTLIINSGPTTTTATITTTLPQPSPQPPPRKLQPPTTTTTPAVNAQKSCAVIGRSQPRLVAFLFLFLQQL